MRNPICVFIWILGPPWVESLNQRDKYVIYSIFYFLKPSILPKITIPHPSGTLLFFLFFPNPFSQVGGQGMIGPNFTTSPMPLTLIFDMYEESNLFLAFCWAYPPSTLVQQKVF